MPKKSPQAGKQQLAAFFATLERELEKVEFFRPPEKRATMTINLRNIFTRMKPTQQDMQTLHGVVTALVEGRKGPPRAAFSPATRRRCCAACWRSAAACRGGSKAGPRADWRGFCAATRPTPSVRCGTRW